MQPEDCVRGWVKGGTLRDLLVRPQAAISRRVASDPNPWILPFLGYAFLAFCKAYQNIENLDLKQSPAASLLIAGAGSLFVGSWLWAGLFGGALHLGARLFGGKEGPSGTIRAIGYALFWPGMLGVAALVLGTFMGQGAGVEGLPFTAGVAVLVSGVWSLYTIVAGLRAWHSLSWWRAVAAYLFLISLILVIVLAVGLIMKGLAG